MACDGCRDQERKVGKTCPHGSSQTRVGRRGEMTVVRPRSSPTEPVMGDRSERWGGSVPSATGWSHLGRGTGRGAVLGTGCWGGLASVAGDDRSVRTVSTSSVGSPRCRGGARWSASDGLREYGSRAEGSTGTNISDGMRPISAGAGEVTGPAPGFSGSLPAARSASLFRRSPSPQAPRRGSPATSMASWMSSQVLRFSWGDRSR